jgi:uncharacterized membrane protein YbhN (UPF0104 family)
MSGDRWRRLVGALRGERGRRLARIAAWVGGTALALVVLDLLGVPVLDWIHKLFREIRQVPTSALIGGVALETVQTTFAAVAWTTILRAAFPNAGVPYRVVLACYATAVALNDFLPANIGSLVMLVMLLGVVAGATFAALVSGWVVQKIPSSVINIAVYLYLFLTVKGSFSIKLGAIAKHPAATVFIAIGAVLLVVIVARVLWSRTEKLRGQLKDGGAVLGQPKRFFRGVVAPEIVAYAARLGLIGVFLSAASIPVTFHTVVSVSASNSVSNSVSVTPGGVGVNQAMNVAALRNVTSASNATKYSVTQQLVVTAWDIIFGLSLVAWVFGWTGGKELLSASYRDARVRSEEMKQASREKRQERRASRKRA